MLYSVFKTEISARVAWFPLTYLIGNTRIDNAKLRVVVGSQSAGGFRFEYEYEIEYENDFSILDFRLQIVTSHTRLMR